MDDKSLALESWRDFLCAIRGPYHVLAAGREEAAVGRGVQQVAQCLEGCSSCSARRAGNTWAAEHKA
eukprot:5891342-Prorocentrum_lima.AAC.1